MTDEVKQPESTPNQGAAANVNATTSGGEGGQPPSVDLATLEPLLEKMVEKYVDRKQQSLKDKRINEIQKNQTDFQKQLSRLNDLMGGGLSQDEALFRMEMEDVLAERRQQSEEGVTQSKGSDVLMDASGLDKEFLGLIGLEPNDPEVINLLMQGKNAREDMIGLALQRKQAQEQRQQTNPATPAGVMPTGSGQQNKPDLEAKYKAEIAQVAGNIDAIIKIKQKYRKLGLNVF